MDLQIYSEQTSNRLSYILELIFTDILGIKYHIINSIDKLKQEFPILNYSSISIPGSVQLIPHTLLFEDDIHQQNIHLEAPYYFFKTSSNPLSFDILASSFYMISRYEEYLPTQLDSHQRFKAENTLAYQHGFLQKAVVHHWANDLKQVLQKHFSELQFISTNYQYISSIDVDNAFAYKAKGVKRLLGGLVKSILKNDKDDIKNRLAYLLLNKKDPFDTFSQIEKIHRKYEIENIFFFLIGENGPFDKNISIEQPALKEIIRHISSVSKVGIHPSYQSNTKEDYLKKEINNLKCTIGKPVQNSRQHFLKLSFPNTYQNLIQQGIKNDFSMGFASQVGFRAGICIPYKWFDLSTNQATNLTIYPFQIMDGTLNDYLKLSPQKAIEAIREINKEVRNVNGTFISLWHNESLALMRQWNNWSGVFESLIEIAK